MTDDKNDAQPIQPIQPIQAIQDKTLRYGTGTTWQPKRRHRDKDYSGTRLTTGNQREKIPNPPETPAVPRVPITEHIVKTHTFGDGTTYTQCQADGCNYGSGEGRTGTTKRHSNGLKNSDLAQHIDEILTEAPEVQSADMPQELSAETDLLAAANGQIEFSPEPENPEPEEQEAGTEEGDE